MVARWLVLIALVTIPVRAQAEQSIVFSSGTSWQVYDADPAVGPATLLGDAQNVCLSPGNPPSCPSDATIYCPARPPAWSADLSMIPSATWIWAPGIDGSTAPAEGDEFFFSKSFPLGNPLGASLSVAVDDLAEVRVNGVSAGTWGSVTNATEALAAQNSLATFDLTPFLISGVNTITIRAENGPFGCGGPCDYCTSPAGVVFGGTLMFEEADDVPAMGFMATVLACLALLAGIAIVFKRSTF